MKISKSVLIAILFLFLTSISTFVVFTALKDNPEETVQKYWQFILDGRTAEAAKLKSSTTAMVSTGEGGTLTGNAVYPDGTVKDCCYGKEIAEKKIKIIKVVGAKEEGQNALVAIETEDKEQKLEVYINCLSKRGGQWTITNVSFDIYEDRNALCFDTGISPKLKKNRF